MRLRLFSLVVPLVLFVSPSTQEGLEPPDLKPLVSRANVLLTAGQFHDAAKSYSDAIELSPADYTLYYKRATAYYSLSRHSAALEDLDTILRMTDGSFHQAFLMKARILAREGDWTKAKQVLKKYTAKAGKSDKDGVDLVSVLLCHRLKSNLPHVALQYLGGRGLQPERRHGPAAEELGPLR